MSMVDFRCMEYSDGTVVADADTRKRINDIGIRKIAHDSGVNHETIALIAKGGRVKSITLAKVIDHGTSITLINESGSTSFGERNGDVPLSVRPVFEKPQAGGILLRCAHSRK